MQQRKRDLRLILMSIEQKHVMNMCDYQTLQSVLIDGDLREQLNSNSKHQEVYSTLYLKSVEIQAQRLVQRSRQLFASVTQAELLDEKISKQPDSKFTLMAQNFNLVASLVELSIAKQGSLDKCCFALEYWHEVMFKCLEEYDYATSMAIFAALSYSYIDKLKATLSRRSRKVSQYMEALTQPKNESENLRDVAVNKSVPLLSIFKKIIISAKEGSVSTYRSEKDPMVIRILKNIADMQKTIQKIMRKKPVQLIRQEKIHAAVLSLLKWLEMRHVEKVEDIPKNLAAAKTLNEMTSIYQDVYRLCTREYFSLADTKTRDNLTKMYDVLKKIQRGFPQQTEQQVNYELNLNQIKDFYRTRSKSDPENIKECKAKLAEVLNELRFYSSCADKVEYLNQIVGPEENKMPDPLTHSLTIDRDSVYSKLLRKLRDAIQAKEELDSYQKYVLTRKQRTIIRNAFLKLGIQSKNTNVNALDKSAPKPTESNQPVERPRDNSDILQETHLSLASANSNPDDKSDSSHNADLTDNSSTRKSITWQTCIRETTQQDIPSNPGLPVAPRKLQRASLNLGTDYSVYDHMHDSSHKLSRSRVDSEREKYLLNKNKLRRSRKAMSNDNLFAISQTATVPSVISVQEEKVEKSAQPVSVATNSASFFEKNSARNRHNKIRWSWPLQEWESAISSDDAGENIVVIKIPLNKKPS